MKSTGRATAPIISVHCAIVVPPACVGSTISHRALEETLATFTCADSIMFASRFVPAYCAVQFVLCLKFMVINDRRIGTSRHVQRSTVQRQNFRLEDALHVYRLKAVRPSS